MEKKYQKGPKTKQVKQNILIRYFELYDSLSVGSFFFIHFYSDNRNSIGQLSFKCYGSFSYLPPSL
jgi:hypothetical protein